MSGAFNGSGVFVLSGPEYPAVATTSIQSAYRNTLDASIATGLSTCIAKDGQSVVSAHIPLAGFKLTGVGAATARTDAATLASIQDGTGVYVATVGGTADVITLTASPAITSYVAGQGFAFIASGTNTGAVTVAINGLTAKAITKNGATALAAGDITSAGLVAIQYDGTRFQLAATFVLPASPTFTTVTTTGNIELGNGSDTTLSRVSGGVMAVEGVNVITTTTGDARYMKQGLVTIPVTASAMQPATTNGAAAANIETTTNKVLYRVLDFDTTTQEFAGFVIPMPKSWNNGTVTFQPLWTFASGSGGVVWALQGVACSDADSTDVAYGTEQTSTDTALTAVQQHIGPTSAAITIAGTPATSDVIYFRIKRNPADGSDTLGTDARLIGIRLFFTQNAADDT